MSVEVVYPYILCRSVEKQLSKSLSGVLWNSRFKSPSGFDSTHQKRKVDEVDVFRIHTAQNIKVICNKQCSIRYIHIATPIVRIANILREMLFFVKFCMSKTTYCGYFFLKSLNITDQWIVFITHPFNPGSDKWRRY